MDHYTHWHYGEKNINTRKSSVINEQLFITYKWIIIIIIIFNYFMIGRDERGRW